MKIVKLSQFKKLSVYIFLIAYLAIFCTNIFAANYALLIGIQNYPTTETFKLRGFQQLSGPQNDIELMREVLQVAPFDFPKENIDVLLNESATHSAIEKAFANLTKKLKPNDLVYIHYSGHGSLREDDNEGNDEILMNLQGQSKRYDSTWVPYGSSAGLYPELSLDDRDILDDEIDNWLSELGKITKKIVFVSDSCHSGSVSRGPRIGMRKIESDPRPYPYQRVNKSPLVGTRIGASQDSELAIEQTLVISNGNQSENKTFGHFTWHWAKALKSVKPGETWRDLFERTKALMRDENMEHGPKISQTPQIIPLMPTNANPDFKVIESDFTQNSIRIAVVAIDTNKKELRLNTGLLGGVTKGSLYRIFSGDDAPRELQAIAEITEVAPFWSKATVKQGSFNVGDLLIVSQPVYYFGAIPVLLEFDHLIEDKQKTSMINAIKMQETVSKPGLFNWITARQEQGWIVHFFQPEKKNGQYVYQKKQTLPNSVPNGLLEAWVLNMREELLDDTMRIDFSNLQTGIEELTKKMKILADMRDVMMLSNELPPGIKLKAHNLIEDAQCNDVTSEGECFVSKISKYRSTETQELSQYDGKVLQKNTRMGLSVENDSRDDYYVYVLNITVKDGATVLFPRDDKTAEFAKVTGKEKRKLDGVLRFTNSGIEILKILVSHKSLDPRAFEFAGTEIRAAQKGPQNPLERLLNYSVRRADVEPAPDPSEWGTVQARIEIQ